MSKSSITLSKTLHYPHFEIVSLATKQSISIFFFGPSLSVSYFFLHLLYPFWLSMCWPSFSSCPPCVSKPTAITDLYASQSFELNLAVFCSRLLWVADLDSLASGSPSDGVPVADTQSIFHFSKSTFFRHAPSHNVYKRERSDSSPHKSISFPCDQNS